MYANDYDLPESPPSFFVWLECIGSIAQAYRDYTNCDFWDMQHFMEILFYGENE